MSLTSKQGTREDYVIRKQEHKTLEEEHEMCKTNVKTNLYYANICKHGHEKKHDKSMVQDHA